MPAAFASTKTYGHEVGLSACFRQWRADSHCRFLHGYALAVRLEFEADALDRRNWVVDFGALKPVKAWLQDTFDHKTLVAEDDPLLPELVALEAKGGCDIILVPATGCEAFAGLVFAFVEGWLASEGLSPRVRLASVEVREHGANSGIARAPVGFPCAD